MSDVPVSVHGFLDSLSFANVMGRRARPNSNCPPKNRTSELKKDYCKHLVLNLDVRLLN